MAALWYTGMLHSLTGAAPCIPRHQAQREVASGARTSCPCCKLHTVCCLAVVMAGVLRAACCGRLSVGCFFVIVMLYLQEIQWLLDISAHHSGMLQNLQCGVGLFTV